MAAGLLRLELIGAGAMAARAARGLQGLLPGEGPARAWTGPQPAAAPSLGLPRALLWSAQHCLLDTLHLYESRGAAHGAFTAQAAGRPAGKISRITQHNSVSR